jgi:Protein of unknown function (DUF3305)
MLNAAPAHATIPVGVVVERRRATSPWADTLWRPVAVLNGLPDALPWTPIAVGEDIATFYLGATQIRLYRTEANHYRANLKSRTPSLWVALRPTGEDPPFTLFAVTADPAEGESFTQVGVDLVEAVPMPPAVRRSVEAFVAEHHVVKPFYRRSRDETVTGAVRQSVSSERKR